MLLRPLFFSSRRRHTRLVSDWSSDVCSSDLLDVRSPGSAGSSLFHLADAQLPDQLLLPIVYQEQHGAVEAQPVIRGDAGQDRVEDKAEPVRLQNVDRKSVV